MKKILIAIPTNNDIEPDTFKSIYDLKIPDGYECEFQYFHGYAVDQVRNLIASWACNFDYLFAVDHDMMFPSDTLEKLLLPDLPIIGGIYRQRTSELNLEIYDFAYRRVDIEDLRNIKESIVQIGAIGFGCVLIKSEVFKNIPYPWFNYHQALDHKNTFSEDIDFCVKATKAGYKIYARKDIEVSHIGKTYFQIPQLNNPSVQLRLRELSEQRLLPSDHINYLEKMSQEGIEPKVIYDIGSCVLHWSSEAQKIWSNSEYFLFEAMDDVKFLYDEQGWDYHLGLLTNMDNKIVSFNQNSYHPGGNSIYDENLDLSPMAKELFPKENKIIKTGMTLDTIVEQRQFPYPDLIKMDIQGSELDVLRGAKKCLEHCEHIILEAQTVDYNLGAPKLDEIVQYLRMRGFKLEDKISQSSPLAVDADYHFVKLIV